MMTWKLWQRLQRDHPLYYPYQRLLTRSVYGKRQPKKSTFPLLTGSTLGFMAGIVVIFLLCTVNWLILVPLLCFLPLLILSAGTLCGAISATQISGTLAASREQGRYELVNLTPDGTQDIVWATAHKIFHTNRLQRSMWRFVVWLGYFSLTVLIVFAVYATLNIIIGRHRLLLGDARGLFPIVMLMLLLFADLIQSILVGTLIGALVANQITERLSASALALGAFLIIQVLFYIAVWLLSTQALQGLYNQLGLKTGFDLYISYVVLFILGRELIIILLWYSLAHQAGFNPR